MGSTGKVFPSPFPLDMTTVVLGQHSPWPCSSFFWASLDSCRGAARPFHSSSLPECLPHSAREGDLAVPA